MNLTTFQSGLKTVLAGAAALAGLEIMLELDETATTAELDAQEALFEREISRKGFVIVISTPRAERIDELRGQVAAGAVHLRVLCQVAFIENPAVNRLATVDPDQPDVTPANRRPLTLIRAAMVAVLGAGYELPAQPLTNPEQDLEGLNLHGLLVAGRDLVRG